MIYHIKKEVDCVYTDIGRIYRIDGNDYYSCTTVLSNTSDKSGLEIWRKRIGEDEADAFTKKAAKTGGDFHALGEAYLLGEDLPKKSFLVEKLFKDCVPLIDKNVTHVFATEIAVWSHLAKIAGRADAVVDWNGSPAIFDFKCIGHDNPEYLKDYWIQLTIYAMCIKEMFGVSITKLILMIANKRNLKCRYFESDSSLHIVDTVDRIKKFRELIK